MSGKMTAAVEYSESRIDNGAAAEKKLISRHWLCAGIVIGLIASLFLFGWIMSLVG